jgi:ribonuclease HI
MVKQKYYVVWKGRQPGIFSTWDECRKQVEAFTGAEYKSFETKALAEKAFQENSKKHIYQTPISAKGKTSLLQKNAIGKPIANSISVDAACSGNPGVLEYQGVETSTKRLLFANGPFPEGTVNIGEFLAIVHGLAYLKKNNSVLPIYSDSRTAISWVKKKAIKTNLERNKATEELFVLVDRAIQWLKSNSYPNPILKWETQSWGENPADFGRK